MSKIEIREARIDDLTILLQFEQAIIEYERPFDETLNVDPISYYDLKELIASEAAYVAVATSNGGLVGSGYAKILQAKEYLDHKQYAYLGFMYTDPEYRGNGINRMIINKLKEWTKSKGISEMRLEVYDENKSAVSAYEKAGFQKNLVEMRYRIVD